MKYIVRLFVFYFILAGTLPSCISSEEINYFQAIDKQYSMPGYKEYRLAVGDIISCAISTGDEGLVNLFRSVISDNQNEVKTYTIYSDSTINVPFFGSAKIAGHTVQEAEVIIQKAMEKTAFKDVQVKVSIANNWFYIYSGETRGSYQVYKDNMTIYQALAIAQQTTKTMDLTRVTIVRKSSDGTTENKTFDLRSQDVIESEFYYIQPNDLIYFPTNKNSFFNIDSFGSFVSAISIPFNLLLTVIVYSGL